jgi:hypothetical protein
MEDRVAWLPLTRLVKEIKEHRRKDFEEMIKKQTQEMMGGFNPEEDPTMPKDELGRTVEYYKDLGVEPPAELLEETRQAMRGIKIPYNDDDFELRERKVRIPERIIDTVMESSATAEEGCILMLTDGRLFFIKETINQIDKLLELCQST